MGRGVAHANHPRNYNHSRYPQNYQNHAPPPHYNHQRIKYNHGRGGDEENNPNHVLLLTVINPQYNINCDLVNQICSSYGKVNRIVIFRKNGVQAMVEFDNLESARRAKSGLNGFDIYSGCCTLRIEYAKPSRLNVHKNDNDSYDYANPNLSNSIDNNNQHEETSASGSNVNLQAHPESSAQENVSESQDDHDVNSIMAHQPTQIKPQQADALSNQKLSNANNHFHANDSQQTETNPQQAVGYQNINKHESVPGSLPFPDGRPANLAVARASGQTSMYSGNQDTAYAHEENQLQNPHSHYEQNNPHQQHHSSEQHHRSRSGGRMDNRRARYLYPPNNQTLLGGGPQGTVLMVYGLQSDRLNCDRLFNLFCLYGNVARIKFLRSKQGCAMVQMGDIGALNRSLSSLNRVSMFGTDMQISYSKQPFLHEVSQPFSLPDGTPSFKDFMNSKNNRFNNPDIASKNRILPPSPVLHFFNAPLGITEEELMHLFKQTTGYEPVSIKIFTPKAENTKSFSGLAVFKDLIEATEALILCNHMSIPKADGPHPYILRLCFSPPNYAKSSSHVSHHENQAQEQIRA